MNPPVISSSSVPSAIPAEACQGLFQEGTAFVKNAKEFFGRKVEILRSNDLARKVGTGIFVGCVALLAYKVGSVALLLLEQCFHLALSLALGTVLLSGAYLAGKFLINCLYQKKTL